MSISCDNLNLNKNNKTKIMASKSVHFNGDTEIELQTIKPSVINKPTLIVTSDESSSSISKITKIPNGVSIEKDEDSSSDTYVQNQTQPKKITVNFHTEIPN